MFDAMMKERGQNRGLSPIRMTLGRDANRGTPPFPHWSGLAGSLPDDSGVASGEPLAGAIGVDAAGVSWEVGGTTTDCPTGDFSAGIAALGMTLTSLSRLSSSNSLTVKSATLK